MSKTVYRWIWGLGLAVLITSSVVAQELKVSMTPNPVAPGGRVRVTLQTGGVAVKQPVVVLAGRRIGLSQVGDGLYTASVTVPNGTKPGGINAVVRFVSAAGRELTIPTQVDVVAGAARANNVRAGEGGQSVSASDTSTELTIKVDQLESRVNRLQRERDTLSARVKAMTAQVDQLKSQKSTPKSTIDSKQKALDVLRSQLESQQRALDSQSEQLQAQLKSLANREQKVAQSESEIATAKLQLAKQSQDVKSEVARVRALETALRRRETEASQAQDEAKRQLERLSNDQAQLQVRQQAAQALQSSIQTQAAQLESLRRQLGDQDTAVQSLAKKVEADRQSLQTAQKEIASQQTKLAEREQAAAKLADELKKKQAEIQSTTRQLAQDRARIREKESDLESKERSLIDRETQLKSKSVKVDAEETRLRQIEADLKSENALIDRRRAEATVRQQEIAAKESELSKIEADLTVRSARLNQLNQRIDVDRQQLESQRIAMLDQQRAYQALKQSVDADRASVTAKETELNQVSQALETQRRQLATATKQMAMTQADLDKRRVALEANERAYLETQRALQSAKILQQRRESELDAARQVLDGQRADLAAREAQVSETEARSVAIRKEIFDKYAALEDLKRWVQRRSAELQSAYNDASASKEMNELVFNEQFRRLESLTQVLQNRTASLKQLNQTLIERNQQLEIELNEITPSQSQFVLVPYLGHRSYDGSLGLDSGAQFGIRFVGNLARDWGAEYGVGFVPSLEDQKARTVVAFDLNVRRHLARLVYGDIYGLAGIGVDLANSAYLSPQVGLGIKWQLSPDFATRIDALKGRDFLVAVGIERRLSFANNAPKVARIPAPVDIPAIQTSRFQREKSVELTLALDPVRYQYVFPKPVLLDASTHWAAPSILNAIRYGMLSPVSQTAAGVQVEPNRPITLIEAAKMISLAAYLPEMVKALNSTVNYVIAGEIGATYLVDVVVEDQNQKIVRTLRSKARQTIGEYSVSWDGLGDLSRPVPTGDYRVKVTVFGVDNRVLASQAGTIAVLPKTEFNFLSRSKFALFSDLPNGYAAQAYVNEWISMGNSASVIRSVNHVFGRDVDQFGPDQPISRLSFIIAVNNAIQRQRGASFVLADLSPYRDMNLIPPEARTQVGLYISELDYGGDDQRRIRPFESITRAEAATILARFLNWSARYNRITLPE